MPSTRSWIEEETQTFFTQLLFAYKLNPQTVLFLGYTDDRVGAIDYSLKRWSALIRYLDDGNLPIDNNWVEN